MSDFGAAMKVMEELFAKDCVFALATAGESGPSVRMVDTYYEKGAFYVVTYAISCKVKELSVNENVALCGTHAHRFDGAARNIGHPLAQENTVIRETLVRVFEPWYFRHNNEEDESMCYVKIDLRHGFFHKDGKGYKVDFQTEEVESFPFAFDMDVS